MPGGHRRHRCSPTLARTSALDLANAVESEHNHVR